MRKVLGSADCVDAANSSCEEVVDAECESFAEDEELPIAKECHTIVPCGLQEHEW